MCKIICAKYAKKKKRYYLCQVMITELSIVIPVYNQECVSLVKALQEQASQVVGLSYEIIVADDGSTVPKSIEINRQINALPYCRLIERKENTGRSAIRNFLAREARYDWLLFIDSRMHIGKDDYLSTYLASESADVVYGSYTVNRPPSGHSNLRYIYEEHYLRHHPSSIRQEHPFHDFHSSNFLARRTTLVNCPFDERFKHYGYEDVLYGRQLEKYGARLVHIDNPVVFDHFESNEQYVEKTEEALSTLYTYHEDLSGYSRMTQLTSKLSRWHLLWLVRLSYRFMGKSWRKRCIGKRPTLRAFNFYRLGYYAELLANNKKT